MTFKKETAAGVRWLEIVESTRLEWDEKRGEHILVPCVLTALKTIKNGKHKATRLKPTEKTVSELVAWSQDNGYMEFNV